MLLNPLATRWISARRVGQIAAGALLMLAATSFAAAPAQADGPRPNILMIAVDDLRPELVDLYPTLAELAALPVPGHLDGSSLATVVASPTAAPDDIAISQYPRGGNADTGGKTMGYSLRTDRWRYTETLVPAAYTTLPEPAQVGPKTYSLLKKAGYRTGLIGKTHILPVEAVESYVDFRFQKSSNFAKNSKHNPCNT